MIRLLGYELYCTYLLENNSLLAYSLHYSKEESTEHMRKIMDYHRLSGNIVTSNKLDEWLEEQIKNRNVPEFVWENLPYYKNHEVYEYLLNLKGTATYPELAEELGKGVREVIATLKRNPFLILIPCHRVLGKRDISGYTPLGKEFKEKLLEHEKV